MQQLLNGVRILDLTKATSGPFATQILGDLGAEIIKIEEPPGTPLERSILEPKKALAGGMDPYFLSVNRNKKSVVLPLAHPEGLAAFHHLVEHADVVVDNYRPGTSEKLGVDYETLKAIKPGIITCSLTGYGSNGPMSKRTAFDITVLAETGMIDYVNKRGTDGQLAYPIVSIADLLAGMYCAIAIPAALRQQMETGEGCQIDVAMYDSVLSWFIGYGVTLLNLGSASHVSEASLWGIFPTMTRPLVITAHRSVPWLRFCRAIDREEWLTDDRFKDADSRTKNIDLLKGLVSEVLVTKSADEWRTIFESSGVPYGEIRTVEEALGNPQTAAREMILDVDYPSGPVRLLGNPIKVKGAEARYTPPPGYGEHTQSTLKDLLGYSDAEIDRISVLGDLGKEVSDEHGAQ